MERGHGRAGWGMADDLTLMAVHAHPDDEASSTGGVLAKYADGGVRTVVVTCTKRRVRGRARRRQARGGRSRRAGSGGDQARGAEGVLQASWGSPTSSCSATTTPACRTGTTRTGRNAFCNVPLAEVAGRIGVLIERYRPQVVVTYDATAPTSTPTMCTRPRGGRGRGGHRDPGQALPDRHARQRLAGAVGGAA